MRVLVTGAGGLVGGRLASLLARHHLVVAASRRSAPPPEIPARLFDLTDATALEAALEAVQPQAVVHAAALADADRCEADPSRAEIENVRVPEVLARLCAARAIRLLLLSTDLVFDGERAWVDEGVTASPLSVYGRTKLAGEDAALAAHPGSAVVRVALVLGRGHGPRRTASEAVAHALRSGTRVRLFTDQYRTPVDPESVAQALEVLLAGAQTGRFHLGGPERLSRYELGRRVAAVLGLSADGLEPITQADLPQAAPRPADVSMSSERARRELGYEPRAVEEAIRDSRIG